MKIGVETRLCEPGHQVGVHQTVSEFVEPRGSLILSSIHPLCRITHACSRPQIRLRNLLVAPDGNGKRRRDNHQDNLQAPPIFERSRRRFLGIDFA